jgi:hypothetical protein
MFETIVLALSLFAYAKLHACVWWASRRGR